MPRTSTLSVLAILIGAVALFTAAPPSAGAASTDPGLCLNGGWHSLQADDGGRFKSEKDCLHYVDKGGTVYAPTLQVVVFCFSNSVDLGVFASGFHSGSVATLTLQGALWSTGSDTKTSTFEDETSPGGIPGALIVEPTLHISVAGGMTDGTTPITVTLRDAQGVNATTSASVYCPRA